VQSIALDAISESASVDLTQVGAHAALRSGGFVANAAAIYGFGDVGVSRNLPGLVATAALRSCGACWARPATACGSATGAWCRRSGSTGSGS
jgi:hypothetical protein